MIFSAVPDENVSNSVVSTPSSLKVFAVWLATRTTFIVELVHAGDGQEDVIAVVVPVRRRRDDAWIGLW